MFESLHYHISQKVSEIFDLYTELHGVRISLFTPNGELLYPDPKGRPNCKHCQLLRKDLGMDPLCRELDRTMMEKALESHELITYTCHAGMREATLPLMINNEVAGFVMIGQFRSETAPNRSPYAADWKAQQQNSDLQEAYNETLMLPEEKIGKLLALFRLLIEFIISSQLIHHKDYDLIAPVIEHLSSQPEHYLRLDEAARMTGRSPSTVSRLFKKITGLSFKQYQVRDRLQRAADQLKRYPNRPVTEIALSLGFEDPLYFSRLFHKHMGASPSDFRKQAKA